MAILSGASVDPTRKPLTESQLALFKALEKATKAESAAADKLDELDDQYLSKQREKLQALRTASAEAQLALAKALKDAGRRILPDGTPLDVSVTWEDAARSFVQPSFRDTKEHTDYVIVIGSDKDAVKYKQTETVLGSEKKLGVKPILKPIDAEKLIDKKATAKAIADAIAKENAKAAKPPKAKAKK